MAPNVLVTNDDGVESPGLWALVEAVQPFADKVYVVAPSVNQSAVGAGITLRRELYWKSVESPPVAEVEAWHVNGTPGDCVIVGLRRIVDHRISVIVSGINDGANLGNDILASGTVGGAFQGHFRGLTSLAFSQFRKDGEETDWSTSREVARDIFEATIAKGRAGNVFLNVNVPRLPYEEIRGTLVTRMGRSGALDLIKVSKDSAVVDRRTDLHTHPDAPPGSDMWAVLHGYISVSPIHSNLTNHGLLDALGEHLNSGTPTDE